MNAPELVSPPAAAVAVASLPIDAIVASPSNPRKRIDDAYIAELADSIKNHGLIQPITVRPNPSNNDVKLYEIVVGECRWRAARRAGLFDIPAFWRELDDKQVLEIQIIENLNRRDVHPIEEAEGYEQLMQRHGYKADEIAAKIGKSRGYVYARLKLTALRDEAREAFFAGRLDASTALLVARIPGAALQKRAVKEITSGHDSQPMSYRNAKHHIRHHFTVSLKQATFPLGDAELVPAAGACATCPKRSGNAPELCADLDDEDVCTDTVCFDDKCIARRQQLIDQAEQRGIAVFSGEKAEEIAPFGLGSLDEDQYINLDDTVDGDAEQRTYREILGDDLPVAALLETTRFGQKIIVEIGEPTALDNALREAGWQSGLGLSGGDFQNTEQHRHDHAAERAARAALEAAREAEKSRRRQMRDDILARLNNPGLGGNLDGLMHIFIAAFMRSQCTYGDIDTDYLETIGYALPDEYDLEEEVEKLITTLKAWPLSKAMALPLYHLLNDDLRTGYDWKVGDPTPPTLQSLADYVGLYPTPAAQAQGDVAAAAAPAETEPEAPKKPAAKKTKAKAYPAPATPANEAAAPPETTGLTDWPFPGTGP